MLNYKANDTKIIKITILTNCYRAAGVYLKNHQFLRERKGQTIKQVNLNIFNGSLKIHTKASKVANKIYKRILCSHKM